MKLPKPGTNGHWNLCCGGFAGFILLIVVLGLVKDSGVFG